MYDIVTTPTQFQPKTTDPRITPIGFDTNLCLHIIRVYMTQDGQSTANHLFISGLTILWFAPRKQKYLRPILGQYLTLLYNGLLRRRKNVCF